MDVLKHLLQLIRVRSSCRYFQPNVKISQEEKDILLRSIDMGPSAGGLYAYSVYHSETKKKKIQAAALDQKQISSCSIIFLMCARPQDSVQKYGQRGELYSVQDATIAGMNITLAATAMGLGSCWIGSIDVNKMKELFGVPAEEIPLSLICIGRWKNGKNNLKK